MVLEKHKGKGEQNVLGQRRQRRHRPLGSRMHGGWFGAREELEATDEAPFLGLQVGPLQEPPQLAEK